MKTSLLSLVAILPVTSLAQLLTFGFQGGVPTQTPLGDSSGRIPFTLGPIVNVRILSRLSLESGVLFYRMGDTNQNFAFLFPENSLTLGTDRWRARAIELPFVLKYRFLSEHRMWRPFISAGPAVRRTSIEFNSVRSVLGGNPVSNTGGVIPRIDSSSVKWNLDPVGGAGVSFRAGRFLIEPEVRYSYWGAGKNSEVRKNQVHLLFGFRF